MFKQGDHVLYDEGQGENYAKVEGRVTRIVGGKVYFTVTIVHKNCEYNPFKPVGQEDWAWDNQLKIID